MVRTGRATVVLVAAVVADGLLVGASLDQSIKQLPARHRIGVEAFSAYSQAADLRNGVAWYATLGLGAAALTLAAAALGGRASTRPPRQRRALATAIDPSGRSPGAPRFSPGPTAPSSDAGPDRLLEPTQGIT